MINILGVSPSSLSAKEDDASVIVHHADQGTKRLVTGDVVTISGTPVNGEGKLVIGGVTLYSCFWKWSKQENETVARENDWNCL